MKLKNILAALLFTALLFLISIYLQAQHHIPATGSQVPEYTMHYEHSVSKKAISRDQYRKIFKIHIFQTVAGNIMIPTKKDVHHKIPNRVEVIMFTSADIRAILRKNIDITLDL